MTPAELSRTVLRTVRCAVEAGELRVTVPTRAVVRRPPRPGCGDYATNIALQLAGSAGHTPRRVAEILRPRLAQASGVARVEIADPGFLNITLDSASHSGLVRQVLGQADAYGYGDALAGRTVVLAFRHETRAAVTADAVARIMRTQGADITLRCEPGAGQSRASGGDPDWAGLGVNVPSRLSAAADAPESFGDEASVNVDGSRPARPGTGSASAAGAASSAVVRSSSASAPSASVIRPVPVALSADELLRTLGPDAARWALLRPAAHDHVRVDAQELLAQREVNPLFRIRYAHARTCALLRNAADLGVPGEAGTLHPAVDDLPAIDDLAAPDDLATPDDLGSPDALPVVDDLLGAIGEYPAVLASAARLRAPDRVARHLEATADAFFRFHDTCPVLPRGDEKPEAAHRARVALAQAAGTVLAGGLHLLGITAPAHL
ncbi:ArgS-related anticodon-binding protein NrtL [Streptomyces sp. NPDC001922]|uniref:ArgS-related anticodon-binding protein NrtL n=1 Tax=Streptomyces sp. NPDC001922 TaxID=3364624 RepID=UPI0036BF2B6D